jgi:ABC-2 type transport system permease protein
MNSRSQVVSESIETRTVSTSAIAMPSSFYWAVRRELWESRSIYLAPLAVAGFAFLAFTLSVIAGIWERPLRLDVSRSYVAVAAPFNMLAGLMMFTGMVVGLFYCLDALHSERRDRSILFWKSLPVSDVTTVLAKASIPLLILPFLLSMITFVTHVLMLLVSSAVVMATGQSVIELWTKVSLFRMTLLLIYHFFTAHAIWPAPIYCWLLLVSGWPRRAAFLWAALPVLAVSGVERIAFGTLHFASLVGRRFIGDAPSLVDAAEKFPTGPMTHVTPGMFLGTPGLWLGLLLSAVFLFAAIRLRRYQGPI